MTKLQELLMKQSETRERINVLLNTAEVDRADNHETELRELTTTATGIEPEIRAAMVTEPDPAAVVTGAPTDPETRERINLRGRAHLGGFLAAALAGRIPSGAEAEYGAACGATPGEIPPDLFEQDRPAPETRDATPAPATGTGVTVAPVQPFVFAESIAPRLGIDMPNAPSGGYSEMTITTALTPQPEGKGDDADGTAAALTPVTANPRRISARLTLAVEDVAQVGVANFEAALRGHTSMALSDAYDNQAINGNGAAPNVEGLIDQLADPTDPTDVADFDAFVAAFANQIDGLWASRLAEVGIVANVDAYKLSAKTFRDGSGGQSRAGEIAFADYARLHMGGWWTNKRMPATAATLARGIVYRQGRPGLRTACHPTWGTISIDDIYTDSASGQRHFTIHVLVGDKVLLVQPAAYGLVEFKVS